MVGTRAIAARCLPNKLVVLETADFVLDLSIMHLLTVICFIVESPLEAVSFWTLIKSNAFYCHFIFF